MAVKSTSPSLFEMWLGWIGYAGHDCPLGLKAREFLLGEVNRLKKIPTDRQLWDAAPLDIRDGFRSQFGGPEYSKVVGELNSQMRGLRNSIARLTNKDYTNPPLKTDDPAITALKTRHGQLTKLTEAELGKDERYPRFTKFGSSPTVVWTKK